MKRLLILMSAALLVLSTACAKKKTDTAATQQKVLVAYFSATGTTENVAKMIASATGGELMKIQPKEEYSDEDLDWTEPTSRCCRENDNPQSRPEFVKSKASLDGYDVVYLGFPNWWNMAPRIINTFIEAYDLKGKKVIPFSTSGGSGIENSVKQLRAAYPDLSISDGKMLNFVKEKDIEKFVEQQ